MDHLGGRSVEAFAVTSATNSASVFQDLRRIDAFNSRMTEQKKNLPLSEVRRQLSGHIANSSTFETVPEEYFAGETAFGHRLRLDTYGHYPKHARAIRKWREALELTNSNVFRLRLVSEALSTHVSKRRVFLNG
jgi:hypothetical protein